MPEDPDLGLLDVTIGYPGVPYGKYPQDHYGLNSIFFRGVAPPMVSIHLHLYTQLGTPECGIPSLISSVHPDHPSFKPLKKGDIADPDAILPSKEESRAFEMWMRGRWEEKEKRLTEYYQQPYGPKQRFEGVGGPDAREIIKLRET